MRYPWLGVALVGVIATGAEGQARLPGAPEAPGGRPASPAFEGWYQNPDGSFTLSFGYFNRDQTETIEVPPGADNFIEPAEFDGAQPGIFAPRRHVGAFVVTVPADFADGGGQVVWTIRNRGVNYSVPGQPGSDAYQLHYGPMAMGSLPPLLKLDSAGPELWGVMTQDGDPRASWETQAVLGSVTDPVPMSARVGEPLQLTVWAEDRLEPGAERDPVPPGVTWYTHQGPTSAVFANAAPDPDASGRVETTVTFEVPGRYLLRVRADNFNPVDSTPGDQCCWTNGYVEVSVTR